MRLISAVLAIVCWSTLPTLAAGCAGVRPPSDAIARAMVSKTAAVGSALLNGRSIFQTGRDAAGARIRASTKPLYPNCAACHNADGSGGKQLPGGAISADLRYGALIAGQRRPYTLPLLERAITKGIDSAGAPLNPAMPRWRLSQKDLHDVALYVLETFDRAPRATRKPSSTG